jgi:hypothetical protein
MSRRRGASAAAILALVAALCPQAGPVAAAQSDGRCPTTAAATLGWPAPDRSDDFTGPLRGWGVYDGKGHNGNGRRTPQAISTSDGILTITGDAQGNSGGMAWFPGQREGRWEVCAMATPAAPTYHAVLLLWPDSGNWPAGGEVDFMEISDPSRQSVDGFLHYGPDNNQDSGSLAIDATQWHSWAVEWTRDELTMYVDGHAWWSTRDRDHLPPGAMHLCIQLDNFGGDTRDGGRLMVDWARQYPV